MAGTVTLVRTIWRETAPQLSTVPPLGCGATLAQMLLIDGEGPYRSSTFPNCV